MTRFYPEEYESRGYDVISMDFSQIGRHTMDLPEYVLESPMKLVEGKLPAADENEFMRQLSAYMTRYQKEEPDLITKTTAIVASLGLNTKLLYYCHSDDYYNDCFGVMGEDEQEEE